MGLGILTDPYLGDDVPGTSRLDDPCNLTRSIHAPSEKSSMNSSKNDILLIPQPSSSPNDPLNWPRWTKVMLMVILTFGVGITSAWAAVISAGLPEVAISLHTSLDSLSRMAGDMTLATALVVVFAVPLIVVYGRRPAFLIGSALVLASTVWSAVAKTAEDLVASRVIGAMGMALTESFAEVIIADVFFVHERATLLALWNLALLCGYCGASIANGYLIQYISWRVCFAIEAALCAVVFILIVFFFPETAFIRDAVPSETETIAECNQKPKDKVDDVSEEDVVPRRSYWRSLRPWSGCRFSNQNIWKITLQPFILLCSPAVAWATFIYGTTVTWISALSISISIVFSPSVSGYNLSAGGVGLIGGVGPLIGGILGNVLAGLVSDWSVKWLSRWNGGIYEPEFRLLLIIPMLVFTTIGWIGWAVTAHFRTSWIGPATFYSVIYFGSAMGSVGLFAYVVDAHGDHAPESFAMINLFKSLFTFALAYVFVPWLSHQGIFRVFCTICGINFCVCLLTVPMYIYGKRARSWVHRTPWMPS